jgi:hypothetical protein
LISIQTHVFYVRGKVYVMFYSWARHALLLRSVFTSVDLSTEFFYDRHFLLLERNWVWGEWGRGRGCVRWGISRTRGLNNRNLPCFEIYPSNSTRSPSKNTLPAFTNNVGWCRSDGKSQTGFLSPHPPPTPHLRRLLIDQPGYLFCPRIPFVIFDIRSLKLRSVNMGLSTANGQIIFEFCAKYRWNSNP